MRAPRAAAFSLLTAFAATACKNPARESAPVAPDSIAAGQRPLLVSTGAELLAAIASVQPGATVLLQPGEYEIANTLVIPDHVTLLGSGVMKLDERGRLPAGFDPSTQTVLKSAAGLKGDVLTLGNRSAARGLAIEDAAGRSSGNVVAVRSRGAGDIVSATLEDCEISNPNEDGDNRDGPIGRSVVAATGAPSSTARADSSAPSGASVVLRMSHCIVHSPRGTGVFATNLAPHGRINLVLTENIIGGGLTATGGASHTFAVSGASTVVESRRNVFRADSGTPPTTAGWLISAVTTPLARDISAHAATHDTVHLHSTGDRIEGFQTGISAYGALRMRPDAEVLAENVATLELQQTEIRSVESDFDLAGARSLAPGAFIDSANVLRLIASGITGGGARGNSYLMTSGPPGTSWRIGNRVEVSGSPSAFARANQRITPPPPREFFNAARKNAPGVFSR